MRASLNVSFPEGEIQIDSAANAARRPSTEAKRYIQSQPPSQRIVAWAGAAGNRHSALIPSCTDFGYSLEIEEAEPLRTR
jgi:hypothetical protein